MSSSLPNEGAGGGSPLPETDPTIEKLLENGYRGHEGERVPHRFPWPSVPHLAPHLPVVRVVTRGRILARVDAPRAAVNCVRVYHDHKPHRRRA